MYYKLLDQSESGELVSPYGKDGDNHFLWKIGVWEKSNNYFYASETIVEALSAVYVEHFSVIARVDVREEIATTQKIFTEIIAKEMRIVEAYLWPETLRAMIKRNVQHSEIAGMIVAQPSVSFFENLSTKEKEDWETFLVKEMQTFVPYKK